MEDQAPQDQLLGFAITGIEAETFLDSRLGKYMTEMVEGRREAATADFKNLDDPGNEKEVKRILLEMKVCDMFDELIKCAIEGGKAAQMDLERQAAFD